MKSSATRGAGRLLVLFSLAASHIASSYPGHPGATPPRGAFDYRSDLRPGHETSVLVRGDFNGDGIPDLAAAGPDRLTAFLQGRTSFDWKPVRTERSGTLPVAAASGRFNGDARDDVVLLCGAKPTVAEIYLSDQRGVPVLSSTIELPADYRQALVADPDADRVQDLLFFGKKTLGIALYQGKGTGAFAPGPVLFPDVPVAQAVIAPMDGDDIPDAVVADWLGNSIQVFPGFGDAHFGEPSVVALDGEPVALAVGDLNGDRTRDIAAGIAEGPAIAVYAGDGKGHFTPAARSTIEASPERIRIGDIDGDARNDLLVFLPAAGAVSVRLQDSTGSFAAEQTYAAGSGPSDAVLFAGSKRKALNAAVLDGGVPGLRLLHGGSASAPDPASIALATGVEPAGLAVADLNDDGWPDVVLAQGAEPVVSVFLNDGRGSLVGQVNVPVPFSPAILTALAPLAGAKDYLATGKGGGSITYLSLDAGSMTAAAMTIRPGGGMHGVGGRRLGDSDVRRVYAMHDGNPERGASVYAYDLSERGRSEEAEIRLEFPGTMAAATSCDFDADGRADIALLSVDDSAATVTFYRQADDGYRRQRANRIVLPPGADPAGALLWIADLAGDGALDAVLNFRLPSNMLAVVMSAGDTAYGPPVVVLTDARISAPASLAATDFDADGKPDLVFVNDRTGTVQFLPGNGKGRFERPVNLTGARGVRGFGVGDLNRDGEQELILSNVDDGALTVTSFHHPLFSRKRGAGRD